MHQIIQLRPDDDILTIRARIENAELAHLVLVVPRDCAFLESASGLQLVRRAADDLGAQIALVAHDDMVRERAVEYGFPVFNSLTQAQHARWKMQAPTRATTIHAANVPPPAPPESVADSFVTRIFEEWRGPILAIAGVLVLLGIAAFIFIIYSLATIVQMLVLGGQPASASEAFTLLQKSKLVGLLRLDLPTILVMPLYYFFYLGLYAALRETKRPASHSVACWIIVPGCSTSRNSTTTSFH